MLILACGTAGMSAWAQTAPSDAGQSAPPSPPAWSAGEIRFSGLIDGYYDLNFNHPSSGTNLYRNFDVKANQFSLNMAKLTLEHDADPVGFKIDLGFGRAFTLFHATEPGGDILNWVPQAYVSLKPKNWKGTQFDFGKFYTSAGAEPTENNLNWNYSRSLLYANGPYYHFGLRVTQPVNDKLGVGFQLVNGWNNVEDNNSGKTIGLTTALAFKKWSWFNNYYTGPEKPRTNKGFRNFYDTVLTLSPSDAASFYLNLDYGTEKMLTGGSQDWIGVAGAAHFTKGHWAFTPRLEYYYDKDGFITGTAQKLKEVTLTGEYKWAEGLLSRLEYRRDWSDQPVFERGTGGTNKNQDTVLFGLVAFFGPKR
jgi:hypothetical protein